MSRSVYEEILENIKDGALPEGFGLSGGEAEEGEIGWAPGAMDGVFIYHSAHEGPDEEQLGRIYEAVDCAASGNYEKADEMFAEATADCSAISIVNELQRYVAYHAEDFDSDVLFGTACYLARESSNAECVKAGLEIMELYDISEPEVRDMIRNLGLFDEFTIYSVWSMRNWENGNDEIFRLAKKVRGWGRIHAIEFLEPVTEEIRRWLLTEGFENDVMNEYSALTCWQKSGAEEILFGDPTREEYESIASLLWNMIDEGPVAGISGVEDPGKVLRRFIQISEGRELTDSDRELINEIKGMLK